MKRIISVAFFSIIIISVQAQDAKAVKKALDSKDLAAAKANVDAMVAKSPTGEAWYLKSKVYSLLAANDQLKATVPDARMQAFDAFKKAIRTGEKDKALIILQAQEGSNYYKPLFDLYTGYYDEGAKYFNSGANNSSKADFEQAMINFKNANLIGGYIAKNKWALSELDTMLVLNIAKSALNAEKTDEALIWLKTIADNKIKDTDGSGGFKLAYQWLTFYYKDKGDEANMMKYAGIGKELYPGDDYYDGVILDYLRKKGDKETLFKKYAEVVKAFPDSLNYHFNYANDAFNYIYNSNAGTPVNNKEALLVTVGEQLENAIRLDPNNINTNWLYGQYFYNAGIDIKEKAIAIKSTKPEDVKKKADLNAQANVQFNKAVPFVEKAISLLESGFKKGDKSKYKSIADLGQRIYASMGMKDKEKIYIQKYDGADTKFVN